MKRFPSYHFPPLLVYVKGCLKSLSKPRYQYRQQALLTKISSRYWDRFQCMIWVNAAWASVRLKQVAHAPGSQANRPQHHEFSN
ncbi:hypothetical protein DESC_780387 [Desulfosarcina cetonica]|nr:hypothetical protein DESC_780387 [Desulfosarcina cetonica]